MKEERMVRVEERPYEVLISDDQQELIKAHAAGKTIIGVWNPENAKQSLFPALFVVECGMEIDDGYLERAVRRRLGMPWIMGETSRLQIREFAMTDIPFAEQSSMDTEKDRVFYHTQKLKAYITCQYGFYQYGIWALINKDNGRLVGKAGLTQADLKLWELQGLKKPDEDVQDRLNLELGYHIFTPYRRNGYAGEACRWILHYAKEYLEASVFAKIDASNEASIRLADHLGFTCITQKCNGGAKDCCLYGWNC